MYCRARTGGQHVTSLSTNRAADGTVDDLEEGHSMKIGLTRTLAGAAVALLWMAAGVSGIAGNAGPAAVSGNAIDLSSRPPSPPPIFGLAISRTVAQSSVQAGASPAPVLAEHVFINIQALKGISAADFMGTMGIMTAALGFDCSECHNAAGTDKADWAADTPRKIIARRMVTMVTAINQNNFGGRQMVTCWSAHRGRDKPVVTPALDLVYGMPTLDPDDLVPASVPGLRKPDEIVDRYLQALGGAQERP